MQEKLYNNRQTFKYKVTMGNVESYFQQQTQQLKANDAMKVSNAPSNKYAIRLKNKFPELPQKIQTVLSQRRVIMDFENVVKQSPVYFIKDKYAVHQGHWKAGLPHGYARVLYKDSNNNFSYYEGLIVEGQPSTFITPTHHEESLYIFADGSFYIGQFKQGRFEGKGILITKNNEVTLDGIFKEGLPHGKITETIIMNSNQGRNSVHRFVGFFSKGKKSGQGEYYINNNLIYQGQFSNGNMHGQGRLINYMNGTEFVGKFVDGKKVQGKVHSANGGVIAVNYNPSDETSEMYYEWPDGKFYIGGFKRQEMHGKGKIYHLNGRVIEGMWNKGHNERVTRVYDVPVPQIMQIKSEYNNVPPNMAYYSERQTVNNNPSVMQTNRRPQQAESEDQNQRMIRNVEFFA